MQTVEPTHPLGQVGAVRGRGELVFDEFLLLRRGEVRKIGQRLQAFGPAAGGSEFFRPERIGGDDSRDQLEPFGTSLA